jgi:hypothetical protein
MLLLFHEVLFDEEEEKKKKMYVNESRNVHDVFTSFDWMI